jgi:hypothetical protein
MNMKKTVKLALTLALLAGGASPIGAVQQTARDVRDRMELLCKLFGKKGLSSFTFLNGHDSPPFGKHHDQLDETEWALLTNGKGTIVCVEDGKYVVHQLQPTLVGQNAMSGLNMWVDGQGMSMIEKIVAALRSSPDGKAVVSYIKPTPGVPNEGEGKPPEEESELLAYSSAAILGHKNDTGVKFFCAVQY